MTVGKLIELLKNYDDNMPVIIGMQQRYGIDFGMKIRDVEEHNIMAFYGKDYKAIVITEGEQCGSVYYDDF